MRVLIQQFSITNLYKNPRWVGRNEQIPWVEQTEVMALTNIRV